MGLRVSLRKSDQKHGARRRKEEKSIFGVDFSLVDVVKLPELFQIGRGTNQHHFGEFPGADVLKACNPFPGADAGVDYRSLGSSVISVRFLLFTKQHAVSPSRCMYLVTLSYRLFWATVNAREGKISSDKGKSLTLKKAGHTA